MSANVRFIELFGAVFLFIWCENGVPTPLFLALHTVINYIFTWSEPLKIRCHAIVTQLSETVKQFARKFRNVSLQAMEWKWVNCKLITASNQLAFVQFECHTGK